MPVTIPSLRDYQIDAQNAICAEWAGGSNRLLVQMATGLGKTTLFASLLSHATIRRWLESFPKNERAMLVIAHRERLIDQAAARIQLMNPGAMVSIEQGDRHANPWSDVVVASIQTLAAMKGRRLKRLLHRTRFRLVVIDEAHHASAATYRNVLVALKFLPPADASDKENTEAADFDDVAKMEEALRGWDAQAPKDQIVIGVTATTNRSDAIGLGCVFQSLAYNYSIKPAVEAGWLVPIVPWVIETTASLDDVRTTHGEFNQKDLAEAVNNTVRNQLAVAAWHEHAPQLPTIAFTVDVAHAYAMAEAFRASGVRAVAVSGETPRDEIRAAFRDFEQGRLDVLTNCMIATEGVDLPTAACILNAKPTKSATLYTQMVGRGLRPHPDDPVGPDRVRLMGGKFKKPHCIVIDLVDISRKHSLQAAPALYGLPPGMKGNGDDLRKLEGELEAFKEQFPTFDVEKALSEGRYTLEQLRAHAKTFDIWTVPELGSVGAGLSLNWIRIGEDRYRIQYPWADGTEVLVVQKDILGRYDISCTLRPREAKEHATRQRTIASQIPTVKEALTCAEAFVAGERGSTVKLKDREAPWRSRPASPKQKALLTRWRVPFSPTITAGDASDRIDIYQSRRGR